MNRQATIHRTTAETEIELSLDLDFDDSSGSASEKRAIFTGVGFLDHMLDLFANHSGFSLSVKCNGDTHIDDHHSVEDIGICLGSALNQALGDKKGIYRYGSFTLPMDETLVTGALDLSGRSAFVWKVEFPTEKIGSFDTQLVEEFWKAFTDNARMNLHVLLHHGSNSHHIAEAVFKSIARCLKTATAVDANSPGRIPSSKGTLT